MWIRMQSDCQRMDNNFNINKRFTFAKSQFQQKRFEIKEKMTKRLELSSKMNRLFRCHTNICF